jgi:hypothetical protein
MIVLFSFEGDKNTNYLIDWLIYYKCPFKRVELEKEDFRKIEITLKNSETNIKLKLNSGEIIDFLDCSFFYIRGKGFKNAIFKNTSSLPNSVYKQYIVNEFKSLTNFFYSEANKKSVGCFYNDSHIKLIQLMHDPGSWPCNWRYIYY